MGGAKEIHIWACFFFSSFFALRWSLGLGRPEEGINGTEIRNESIFHENRCFCALIW